MRILTRPVFPTEKNVLRGGSRYEHASDMSIYSNQNSKGHEVRVSAKGFGVWVTARHASDRASAYTNYGFRVVMSNQLQGEAYEQAK